MGLVIILQTTLFYRSLLLLSPGLLHFHLSEVSFLVGFQTQETLGPEVVKRSTRSLSTSES